MYKIISLRKNTKNELNYPKAYTGGVERNSVLYSEEITAWYVRSNTNGMLEVPNVIVNIIFKFSNSAEVLRKETILFLGNISSIFFDNKDLLTKQFDIKILKDNKSFDKNMQMTLQLVLPSERVLSQHSRVIRSFMRDILRKTNKELNKYIKESEYIDHNNSPDGDVSSGLYFSSSKIAINTDFLLDFNYNLIKIAQDWLYRSHDEMKKKIYKDCLDTLIGILSTVCVSSELIRYLFPPENTFLFVNSSQVFSNSMGASVTGKEIVTMINDKYNYAYEKTIRNYMCGSTIKEYTVNCIRLNCTSITPFSITNNFSLVFSKKDEDQVQTCLSEEDTKKIFRDTILESVYYIVSQVRNITTFYISPSTLNKILTNIETGREPFSK